MGNNHLTLKQWNFFIVNNSIYNYLAARFYSGLLSLAGSAVFAGFQFPEFILAFQMIRIKYPV